MKKFSTAFSIIKAPLDFLMVIAAFAGAYQIRIATENILGKPIDYSQLPAEQEYFIFSLYAAIALVVIFSIRRLYTIKKRIALGNEIKTVFFGWTFWVMAMISYYFLTHTQSFSRLATFYSWGLTLVLIIMVRTGLKLIQEILNHYNIGKVNLLFIGKNQITQEIKKKIDKDQSYKIIDTVGKDSDIIKIIKEKNRRSHSNSLQPKQCQKRRHPRILRTKQHQLPLRTRPIRS